MVTAVVVATVVVDAEEPSVVAPVVVAAVVEPAVVELAVVEELVPRVATVVAEVVVCAAEVGSPLVSSLSQAIIKQERETIRAKIKINFFIIKIQS